MMGCADKCNAIGTTSVSIDQQPQQRGVGDGSGACVGARVHVRICVYVGAHARNAACTRVDAACAAAYARIQSQIVEYINIAEGSRPVNKNVWIMITLVDVVAIPADMQP